MLDEIRLRIRPARVIDVAGEVAPVGAVDGPAGIELEQIFGIELVGVSVRIFLPL